MADEHNPPLETPLPTDDQPKTELNPEPETETETTPTSATAAEDEKEEKEAKEVTEEAEAEETSAAEERREKAFIQPAPSFKEESNRPSDLTDLEHRSLDELKALLEQSFTTPISIYGVPLLTDERTDVILLKFLRARDFNVDQSLTMLKNTLKWRAEFEVDKLVEEAFEEDDLGLEKVVYMHGHDREGHLVCYNVYGEFQNKELYVSTFGSAEKRERFLKWRIQFLEKSIRKLDFRPGGVCTLFQVNDLRNAPGPGKRELRQATRQGLQLLQDNYPEFVAKQVFINVPWWYLAFYTMMSPFMTQRTKSKFVFAGPSKTAETLFKYISPEQVPIQYGGLSVDHCECDPEFTVDDPVTEINLKPATKQFVEIICSEQCVIMWEVRVVGWEVTYSAEFVPTAKDGYTIIIQKATKMASTDNPVISGTFKVSDLGKIVLTVDNPTFKKRRFLYRYKVLPIAE